MVEGTCKNWEILMVSVRTFFLFSVLFTLLHPPSVANATPEEAPESCEPKTVLQSALKVANDFRRKYIFETELETFNREQKAAEELDQAFRKQFDAVAFPYCPSGYIISDDLRLAEAIIGRSESSEHLLPELPRLRVQTSGRLAKLSMEIDQANIITSFVRAEWVQTWRTFLYSKHLSDEDKTNALIKFRGALSAGLAHAKLHEKTEKAIHLANQKHEHPTLAASEPKPKYFKKYLQTVKQVSDAMKPFVKCAQEADQP